MTVKKYIFTIYPAIDYFPRKEIELTDQITIIPRKRNFFDGGFIIKTQAESDDSALEKAYESLNEYYDHYCVLHNTAFQIRGSDEFRITKINDQDTHVSVKHGYFSGLRLQITPKNRQILLQNIIKTRQSKFDFLRLAMKYYRKAKNAVFTEDKIINYFVALEALYSDNNKEMTYRFSNRVAILLSRKNDDRNKLASEIKSLYNIRSRIVHGDIINAESKNLMELDKRVQKSIKAFLTLTESYKNRNEVLRVLDDSILNDSVRHHVWKQMANNRVRS